MSKMYVILTKWNVHALHCDNNKSDSIGKILVLFLWCSSEIIMLRAFTLVAVVIYLMFIGLLRRIFTNIFLRKEAHLKRRLLTHWLEQNSWYFSKFCNIPDPLFCHATILLSHLLFRWQRPDTLAVMAIDLVRVAGSHTMRLQLLRGMATTMIDLTWSKKRQKMEIIIGSCFSGKKGGPKKIVIT